MKWLKRIAFVLSALFVGIQFVRPPRTNPVSDPALALKAPPQVQAILDRSCRDCHSNDTRWPWYSNVAPVSWWLADHIRDGRKELSTSEWASYSARKKSRKLEEICEQVEEGEMPLPSYTWVHREAKLSEEDKRVLCAWAKSERLLLRATPRQNANERPRT